MKNTDEKKIFIINIFYFLTILFLIYIFIFYVLHWFIPFIVGMFISYLLNPIINLIIKKLKIKREIVSTTLIILIYLILLFLITIFSFHLIIIIKNLLIKLPSLIDNKFNLFILHFNNFFYNNTRNFSPETQHQLLTLQYEIINNLKSFFVDFSKRELIYITNFTKKIPNFFITLIFTILASILISARYTNFKEYIKNYSKNLFLFISDIKNIFINIIFKYIKAYFILMIITFIELSIGLMILKEPYFIIISFLIALFDFLPILGTGGIMIPWIIITFMKNNYSFSFGLLILYVIITIIRHFIEPKIIGNQLEMNPIIALISIYLGFYWMGLIGMIIIPILTQIILTLYKTKKIYLLKKDFYRIFINKN